MRSEKRKSANGINYLGVKMKEFRIPPANPKKFKTDGREYLLNGFLLGGDNLLVIGKEYYSTCAKLMRLKLALDLSLSMEWRPQSTITDTYIYDIDVVCLVNLYKPSSDHKEDLLGAVVQKYLKFGTKILMGVSSGSVIEQVFPFDVDTIESEFEIWKL